MAEFIDESEITGKPVADLHHIHLPKLDSAGFIEWDRDALTVRKGPHFQHIQPLLDLLATHADDLPYNFP